MENKDIKLREKVPVRTDKGTIMVTPGTLIKDVLKPLHNEKGEYYLGALLNNRLVGLDEPIWGASTCRGIGLHDHWMGASIHRRSAMIILFEAAQILYPDLILETGQSLGNGYHILSHGVIPDDEHWVEKLMNYCHKIIKEKRVFQRKVVNIEEAMAIFEAEKSRDKSLLLRVWNTDLVHLVTLGSYHDILHGPVALTTEHIDLFKLQPFEGGFVMEFEDVIHIGYGNKPENQKLLFKTYQETRNWNRVLGISSVGQLNELALNGDVKDIIRVCEGFHEKKIAQIADQIASQKRVRVILIAGPSSAGKTTFANRLSVQLRVNGLKPISISLDDYYLNRSDMPRLPDGSYDFEAIEALDLALINEHLSLLLQGKEITLPSFNFITGKREYSKDSKKLIMTDRTLLLIEGIHGLNPKLTSAIDDSSKFKIFVNAITQLNLDRCHRLFTSETRLLRRIVRDRRYRGHNAARTIEMWPSVRAGERKHIFPFQESADVLFNSALLYEPCVIKPFTERYLLEVPRDHPSSAVAYRLRSFLQLFVPILPHDIPHNSILREFVGDGKSY